MDTILDEYSIEGRTLLDVDYYQCKESICPLKEYRCDGINCNVKSIEILK